MAFKEIEDQGPGDGGDSRWFKFTRVGDTLTGKVGAYIAANKFGKPEFEIVGDDGKGRQVELSTDLARKFQRQFGDLSKVPEGLLVKIAFVGTKDVGQPKPMKVFRVAYDEATLPAGFVFPSSESDDSDIGF